VKTKTERILLAFLFTLYFAYSASAQLTPPPPPPPDTNTYTQTNFPAFPDAPPPILVTIGSESLMVDTLPTTADPTQVFPSWATIYASGVIIDSTNGLIDTNAEPSDSDGLAAGSAVGVALNSSLTNAFVITRGEFYVLLTNSSGELQNTRFEVKIMRNTNDFTDLFTEEMALAEYETNSELLSLTPITNAVNSNLYDMYVQFPLCVLAASRVVSIRTEPLDFDIPFAQLQWLIGTSGSNGPATFTTDQTDTNLVAQTNVPAMRLWGLQVRGVGLATQSSQTPTAFHLFTVPGTVITTSTNITSSPFVDFLWPDEQGFGDVDASQASTGFFGLRVDGDP
jgi:hypothetical protein